MATAAPTATMSLDEYLALPHDDSVDRVVIEGELMERPMSRCNRFHGFAMSQVADSLHSWRRTQAKPEGLVFCGDVGFILSRDPLTTFGTDVAYVSLATLSRQTDESTQIVGCPIVAVEVLSPSDMQEDITEKIRLYLRNGTSVVWIVDPDDGSVTMYRSPRKPKFFSGDDEITCEPELPGFRANVSEFFLPEL